MVDFALRGFQQKDLRICDHLINDPVEIRQLGASGVDLEIIGIALGHCPFGIFARGAGEFPDKQGWARGIPEIDIVFRQTTFAAKRGDPIFKFPLGCEFVGIRIILLVELLEVMSRSLQALVLIGLKHFSFNLRPILRPL